MSDMFINMLSGYLNDALLLDIPALEQAGLHTDTIQYMFRNNVKLEQEIVSLELMKV